MQSARASRPLGTGSSRRRRWRWSLLGLASFLAFALLPLGQTFADSVTLPSELQAELVAKLVSYDRSFPARAGNEAVVLIVVKAKDASSTNAAAGMKSALSRIALLGGVSHREIVVAYEGAQSLAQRCRRERASVIYVTPGFDDDVELVGAALVGVDVLSISVLADYVPRGIVLGFELAAGKPKLVLNLGQAKKQNVNFKSDIVKLMKVYR